MILDSHTNGSPKKMAEDVVISPSLIILADNARKTYPADSIARLAENIKLVGLLQPLVVSKVGSKYRLDAGFRRLKALQLLKWREIPVRVMPDDVSDVTLRLHNARNMAENMAREDVPPYEVAIAAHKMVVGTKDEPPIFTLDEAAPFFGVSKKHLSNLIRAVKRCSPVVLDAWKKDPDNIGVAAVLSWAPLDHADQEAKLEEYMGGKRTDGHVSKKGKKKGHQLEVSKRQSIPKMRAKWEGQTGKFAAGVTAALAWVQGDVKSIKE